MKHLKFATQLKSTLTGKLFQTRTRLSQKVKNEYYMYTMTFLIQRMFMTWCVYMCVIKLNSKKIIYTS